MTTVRDVLQSTLDAIKRSERSFICVAISQYSQGDEALEKAAIKAVEKHKPKGKSEFIGWWRLCDRQSRISALEKAIADCG